MTFSRRTFLSSLAIAAMAASYPISAQSAEPPINVLDGDRLAIHGYDPVAYFVDGGPRRGRADLVVEHEGAIWRFASDANRKRFIENPARYTPAFGGYCAYGVAQGSLVKIDPEAWTILNDRLYLNYDLDIRDEWLKDVSGYLKTADTKWPKLVNQP